MCLCNSLESEDALQSGGMAAGISVCVVRCQQGEHTVAQWGMSAFLSWAVMNHAGL